jgi:peptidoglycan biosynthesis protein MviN/MurJ (putative lipid II flippase)
MGMGAITAPSPHAAEPEVASDGSSLRAKHAHAGVAMAIATLAMGATSGIQALLYLSSFGIGGRTDGFFIAFALYTSFGVFSQSIRVTSAPLLVGLRPRLTPTELAMALVAISIPVGIATIPLAGPLASLLAPGLGETGRSVTESALPILGFAMILQLWAAGGATLLAVRDRFDRIAGAYIAGAIAGLIVYLVVSQVAGELSLGWSMLAMAVVTCTMMLEGVRASRPSEGHGVRVAIAGGVGRMARCVWMVLSSTAVYLAFNCLYVITLAFASKYGAGGATVLSYAYLFASYLVAATGFALGMSRIADMSRGALADWREVIAATVPAGFRYAMLLVAPALAALIVGGATLIGDVLPSSFDASQVEQLRVFATLLCAWTLAALLVNLLLPALFALGRTKLVNALAPVVVAAHAGVTALAGALFGVNGVVGAFCIVPLAFAAVLLVAGAGRGWVSIARELARDGLRFVALATISFGIGAAIADSLISGLAAPLLAIGIGGILYGLTTSQLAPRQVRLLVGAVRPASAEA